MKMTLVFLFLLALGLVGPLSLAQPGSSDSKPASDAPLAAKPEDQVSTNQTANAQAPSPSEEASQPASAAPTSSALPAAPVTSAENSDTNLVANATQAAPSSDNRGPLILEQELPAAIQFLARMANMNIQFDPSLVFTNGVVSPDGKSSAPMVSLHWENVTAEDALQEVLDNYGLMLMVNPKTHIGRVTRKRTDVPLVTALVQLRHCSPTNIMDVVKTTFSDPRDKITADLRSSQIVIVTTEREMFAITNLIAHLDSPTKQVLIEAQLLETAKNPTSVKGIDWSGTLQAQNFSFGNGNTVGTTTTTTPGTPTTTTLPSGRTMTTGLGASTVSQLISSVGNGGISANTMSGFTPATAFLNADGVHAVLSFLNTENDTEVVATPRAVTADNQMATLSVTRAFPIFQVTPGSANVAAGAMVQYTNLGTILNVTPRITANSNIALRVIPEVSNIDSKDQQIINGAVNQANVYAIRRMEANVVVPSGSTLVMGGLISDSSSKTFNKVPLLGDLPGLGLLFRHDSKTRNKVNLLIFVTPTIIQDTDFQRTETTFLKTPISDRPDKDWSPWDSGTPYDWNRSSKP
jgi:type II secretory pathway component GspD/PulD (secretin)